MKDQNLVASGYLCAIVCLLINFSGLKAQTLTPRYVSMIPNSNAFYEYLPQAYASESQNYPLLVFIHGVGELGDGSSSSLPTVLRNGPPKLINEGTFPATFTVNGQVFKFIVICPQFIGWPAATDIQGVIDYAVRNYRVNNNRIYLTGLSMGGGGVWDYASFSAAYANRLAAILPVCGASGSTPSKAQIIASANLPVWATHNEIDPTVSPNNTIGWIDAINSSSPRPSVLAKKTMFAANGHDAWTATYNINFKENNLNVYEWMLQYQRGSSQPVNQLPVVNAGSDVTITLPANSVSLAGSATDPDGNITGYSWSRISGPSQFSISNSTATNPAISNLAAGTYTFRLTATDNGGASNYDDVNVIVNAAPSPGVSLPGRIEAENYTTMSGVQSETTSDGGGGKNVGFIDSGDWMDYAVSVSSAGTFTANFRVASPYTSQQLLLKNAAGAVLATVNIPQTGAFQNWTTVTASVTLPTGNQTLRVYSANSGWNFNWLEFLTGAPSTAGSAIPGKIEAENYYVMSGVQSETTSDAGGGMDVGFIDTGDWMDYNVTVNAAGTYTLNFRVASPYAAHQLQFKNASGTILATVTVPQTGAWQNWTTVSTTVTLPAGNQILRVFSVNGGLNINWLEFVSAAQTPSGTVIPGKIEAENYTAMNGVQSETTSDVGAGKNVGFIDTGDWMDYLTTVSTAGTYTVNFRIATPYASQQLQLKNSSGTVLATVSIPQTGAYQSWTTVSTTITLPAGNQTLRIYSSNGGWNINWLEFVSGAQTPSGTVIPGKIEAENYTAMNGVQSETTSDVGAGKNVGFIDTGDWMDYLTTVSTAGTYTVNFRIATPYASQQLQLKNSSGTVLATVSIPQTGAYQSWTTVSTTITLPAGNQTLRIYSSNGGWNINWVEFVSGGNVTNGTMAPSTLSTTMGQDVMKKETFAIFPNPVKDRFVLQMNNTHLGAVDVKIVNLSGKIIKTFKFEKNQQVSNLNMVANELSPGIYFMKVQIGNWSESRKLLKM